MGHPDGGRAASPVQPAATGAWLGLRQLSFSAVAFKSQLHGFIIVE